MIFVAYSQGDYLYKYSNEKITLSTIFTRLYWLGMIYFRNSNNYCISICFNTGLNKQEDLN